MAKDAMFTMKLESALRDNFMEEAAAFERPASQICVSLCVILFKADVRLATTMPGFEPRSNRDCGRRTIQMWS